ncbi:hypothetical protein Y1Q_0020369 [Alligator mississippiensis]|uniref:Uncharacterized protein n=1 Tax=Alligator mississippiensis TaxID=8496 RepID=A0A151N6C9_ALLMI|nr:hypothetical protein Y1Q_0020369 [Alligator mississippiensis]
MHGRESVVHSKTGKRRNGVSTSFAVLSELGALGIQGSHSCKLGLVKEALPPYPGQPSSSREGRRYIIMAICQPQTGWGFFLLR